MSERCLDVLDLALTNATAAQHLILLIAELAENSGGDRDELKARLRATVIYEWGEGFAARERISESMGAPADEVEPMFWLPEWSEWLLESDAEERLGLDRAALAGWPPKRTTKTRRGRRGKGRRHE